MMKIRPILLALLLCLLVLILGGSGEENIRHQTVQRIVAIGDLHGDLQATRSALRLGGAIDEQDRWIGGDLVVVQTGDQLDRGDHEKAIFDLLSRLTHEAAAAGGAFHVLNGNHELMNARLDLRYVTEGGFADFQEFAAESEADSLLQSFPPEQRGRVAAFRPGGPYALVLAKQNLFVIIGKNVFVHGGITPPHLEFGLEKLNDQVRSWLSGRGNCPEIIHTGQSPTWERSFSDDVEADDCELLARVLKELGVDRMVVGHTVQEAGITPLCEGKVWCIDTGMSAHYGGSVQVLEIMGSQVRILGKQ
ncbi:MAG: metallophosphoesterase [Gemmatimonadales bacterium]|nr:metallophosphoesterase [Gemmatimonadales bacterium]